jgi:hypothetical protein
MKKLMTLMLGLTLVTGTTALFAQDKPADKTDKTEKKAKKAKKAKKTDAPADKK